MLTQLRQIAKVFAKVAEEEDALLSRLCDKGIFSMPELAYAYDCGKAVMTDAKGIFGETTVTWRREEKVGLGGPCDLRFELSSGSHIFVEFKVRSTSDKYLADVKKLKELKITDGDFRIFCALSDKFTNEDIDRRLRTFEEEAREANCKLTRLHDPFPQFETRPGKLDCVVAVWLVEGRQDVEPV